MAVDLDFIWTLFRDAVVVLSLPAEEQQRVNGPGCLTCDLLEDFTHACKTFLAHFGDVVTPTQQAAIAEINSLMSGMEAADCECFNDEAVRRPVWQRIREKAGEALRAFECEGATVNPFVEVQPGVWRRPPG